MPRPRAHRRFALGPLALGCLAFVALPAAAVLLLSAPVRTQAAPAAPPTASASPAAAPVQPKAAPVPASSFAAEAAPGAATAAGPAHAPGGEGEGRGEREIVLLHGLGSSAHVWDEVAPILERGFKVWTYELPGHGQTPPLHHLTLETAVADLGRFLLSHDIAYPVLVGHAMGGVIAMKYALETPHAVKRLVIIDAAPKQLASEEEKHHVLDQLMKNYDQFVYERYSHMSPNPDVTARIVDQALRTDQGSFSSLLTSSFHFDLTAELADQNVPILVIGSQLFFPRADSLSAYLDRLGFANARTISFKRMENTGHFVMLEQPAYLASLIGVFASER